jgi:hypothetical protein
MNYNDRILVEQQRTPINSDRGFFIDYFFIQIAPVTNIVVFIKINGKLILFLD